MGYETSYFIINMGSPFLIALIQMLLLLLLYLVTKVTSQNSRARDLYESMVSNVFFNRIIAYIDSLILIIMISSIIAIR